MKRAICVLTVILVCVLGASSRASQKKLSLLVYAHDADGRTMQVRGAIVTVCPDVGSCETEVTTNIGRVVFSLAHEVQFVHVEVTADQWGFCPVSIDYKLTGGPGSSGSPQTQYIMLTDCE